MVHKTLLNRLSMQGFSCSVGSVIPEVQAWLRLTPTISTIWIAAGILLTSPVLLFIFGAVSVFGSTRESHPFDALYNHGIRKLIDAPPLPSNPFPRRFSMALAAGWSTLVGILFMAGAVYWGYVLGTVLLIAGTANILTHFCLGSWIYHKIFRSR